MSAPTQKVRELMLARDMRRCVRCRRLEPLEAQHRQAVGMGGSKKRPQPVELLTACSDCNARFETDLQTEALRKGWKVRKWVRDCARVPVLYPDWGWCVLVGERRRTVTSAQAEELMQEVYGDEWKGWAA